jgi:hypothetical protein
MAAKKKAKKRATSKCVALTAKDRSAISYALDLVSYYAESDPSLDSLLEKYQADVNKAAKKFK